MNLQDIGRLLEQRNQQGPAPSGLGSLSSAMSTQGPVGQDPMEMEQAPADPCGPMPQFGRPYYLLSQGEKDAIISWRTCKAGV